MLFITHELPLLRHVASSIAVMYAGEFVEYGATEKVVFEPSHPYTRALMGAMLSTEPGQRDRKPIAIEGAPPNLGRTLEGCRFAERCSSARANCKTQVQELRILRSREVRCQYAE
jgi:peptide/nickel transport system ATP-binding protein